MFLEDQKSILEHAVQVQIFLYIMWFLKFFRHKYVYHIFYGKVLATTAVSFLP